MSDYPGQIDDFRNYENLPGIAFDPTQSKNIYAEDMINLWEAIRAIQITLGINPQGEYPDVAQRLNALTGGTSGFLATETGNHIVFASGQKIVT